MDCGFEVLANPYYENSHNTKDMYVNVFEATCVGRSQFRRGGLCGRCLAGAGTEQLHVVGWKPAYLTLFPPGLNQSEHSRLLVINCNHSLHVLTLYNQLHNSHVRFIRFE